MTSHTTSGLSVINEHQSKRGTANAKKATGKYV
jgi:hypothetical protein